MAISLFEPRTMMKVVDRMPKTTTFLRDTFFKSREYSETDKIDMDIKQGGLKVAPFVSEKVGGKVVENSGFATKTFAPPLVSPLKITTAGDIQKRGMGENIYSSKTADERAAAKLVSDMSDLDGMITRREELMAAQVIFTGEIEVKGEGVDYVIDFGFKNKEALSGTALWNTATSTKLADLKRWRRAVQQTGFVNTDVVVMAADVADELLKDMEILNLLNIRHANVGQIDVKELPSGATYLGYIAEVGHLYSYNAFYHDEESNTVKPMVPNGHLALLSTEVENAMAYAAITLIKDGEWSTYVTDRVPDSYTKKNPDRQMVQLSSKPLPVPVEINSWYLAKVL